MISKKYESLKVNKTAAVRMAAFRAPKAVNEAWRRPMRGSSESKKMGPARMAVGCTPGGATIHKKTMAQLIRETMEATSAKSIKSAQKQMTRIDNRVVDGLAEPGSELPRRIRHARRQRQKRQTKGTLGPRLTSSRSDGCGRTESGSVGHGVTPVDK